MLLNTEQGNSIRFLLHQNFVRLFCTNAWIITISSITANVPCTQETGIYKTNNDYNDNSSQDSKHRTVGYCMLIRGQGVGGVYRG